MAINKQIANAIKKSLLKFDFSHLKKYKKWKKSILAFDFACDGTSFRGIFPWY